MTTAIYVLIGVLMGVAGYLIGQRQTRPESQNKPLTDEQIARIRKAEREYCNFLKYDGDVQGDDEFTGSMTR